MGIFLLEAGADPNAEMATGWTPLHAAIKKRDTLLEEALKKKNACWAVEAKHKYVPTKQNMFFTSVGSFNGSFLVWQLGTDGHYLKDKLNYLRSLPS